MSTQAVSFMMGARYQRVGVKGWRLAAGGQKMEALRWRPEAETVSQRLKAGAWRLEARIQRPEGGG